MTSSRSLSSAPVTEGSRAEPSSQKPQALARALRFFVASLIATLAPALYAAPTASTGKGPMMLIFPGIVVLIIIVLVLVTRRR